MASIWVVQAASSLGTVFFLVRIHYLLPPECRKKARIREQDERGRTIVNRSFQFSGDVCTFFAAAAAPLCVGSGEYGGGSGRIGRINCVCRRLVAGQCIPIEGAMVLDTSALTIGPSLAGLEVNTLLRAILFLSGTVLRRVKWLEDWHLSGWGRVNVRTRVEEG